ncbi:hypothetical protein, partial [Sinorhizobium sp. Sb3]|uniref:hypothetical protein n=1 Tax=Sinorhizobium sp. Sb3 TaxID=1358417 RepID=UPI001AECAC1C
NIDDRMTLKIDHDRPVQALIDSILRGWRLPKFLLRGVEYVANLLRGGRWPAALVSHFRVSIR